MSVTPLRQQMPGEPEIPTEMANGNDVTAQPVKKRAQSTIEFPYADLDSAVSLAVAIRDKGGAPLQKDQLAAAVGQPVTSGAFVAKIHAARMFGLVEFVANKIKLTELGCDVGDGDALRVRSAKARAFLNVPLFAKAYSEYRNRRLPIRPNGLEEAFVSFGVIDTRKTNARWAFDKSARQAGFFESDEDHLVAPVILGAPVSNGPTEELQANMVDQPPDKPPSPPSAADDFLVRGLLERMPSPGSAWSLRDRVRWLGVLSNNLAMIYGDADEGDIKIEISKPVVTQAPPQPKPAPALPAAEPQGSQPRARTNAAPNWEPAKGGDLDDDIPF